MKANGVKTMGYIGFADAYGDGWLAEMKRSAQTAGIKVVAEEKYNRTDPSVTGQVLKLVVGQSRRDPDRRRRHAGRHAAEGARRRAATRARSTRRTASAIRTSCASSARTATARSCPIGPDARLRAAARPNPVKKAPPDTSRSTSRSSACARRSAATCGTRTCCSRKAIPEAPRRRKPGTPQFRAALRDALENVQRDRRRTACS